MEANFTPDEANELLPTVRPLVERMVEAKRALDAAQAEADDVSARISGNGGGILVENPYYVEPDEFLRSART